MAVWALAGRAGSGKSTLGRALAERVSAVLLDLDVLTNPLLDGVCSAGGVHWNAEERREVVRPARYAALLAVAGAQAGRGLDVVLVAPFTREVAGGSEWEDLQRAVSPERVQVVWLDGPADVLDRRVTDRGELRDDDAPARESAKPRVPHRRVDATLPTPAQVRILVDAAGRP